MPKANAGPNMAIRESALSLISSPVHFDKYVKKGSDGTIFHVGMPMVVMVQQGYSERPFVQFEQMRVPRLQIGT